MFHDFPADIIRSGSPCNGGIELLGTLLLRSDQYFEEVFSKKWTKFWSGRICFWILMIHKWKNSVIKKLTAKAFANTTILFAQFPLTWSVTNIGHKDAKSFMLYNTFFHLKLGKEASFFANTFRRSWPVFCSIFVCCCFCW